jgi:adenylate kinase
MTDVFENLTRLLVLSKPADPLAFLVDVLENRRVQRLILISGVVAPTRQEIVISLANLFNYKIITIEDHFKSHWMNDDEVNEYIYSELKRTERHFRGVIISGYPNNIKQAYYL